MFESDVIKPAIKAIAKVILDKISTTPQFALYLCLSFLSGHLWVFMAVAYRSKSKGNDLLRTTHGTTALGIMWNLALVPPFYMVRFHTYDFEYEKIFDFLAPTMILGFTIQFIMLISYITFGERK